jgi:hypothetical protein
MDILRGENKPESNNNYSNTFCTIPIVIEERINNSDGSILNRGYIKPDKLEKKPPTGAATMNRKTNKPQNMQRRTSCPENIYDQIYEDIVQNFKLDVLN